MNNSSQILRIVKFLLKPFLDNYDFYFLTGDLEEIYLNKRIKDGKPKAEMWLLIQIIKSLPPIILDNLIWSGTMFKSYIKIAVRNLKKQKMFSAINIFGLAAGMSCTILIMLWVQDEMSFDKFHKNADNIYRVVQDQHYSGGEIFPVAVTPGPLSKALKENFPEIVNSVRVKSNRRSLKYEDKIFYERLTYSDSTFFEMFSFPLIAGNPKTVLKNPYSILLSEEMAEKYFGNENPVGKTIIADNKFSLKVEGIFQNVPENSHMQFDFMGSLDLLKEENVNLERWNNSTYHTYVLLQKNTDLNNVNEKIKNIIRDNSSDSYTDVYLQALTDIHLYSGSKYAADIKGHGSIEYVNMFSLIALFVLLIACINFMNLSTARSSKRAKEVGLRKVVGAPRSQIIRQFFVESILLTVIALVLSFVIVYLLLPEFNDLSGKTIDMFKADTSLFFGIFLIAVLTGIISGSYPAFYLSSFLPVKVLKQQNSSDKGGSLFSKLLVVTQFSLSIILIIGTAVVYKQLEYIQNKNLGYSKDNIMFIPVSDKVKERIESVKSQLSKNPNVISSTLTDQLLTNYGNSTSNFHWEGKNENDNVNINFVEADEDFVKTFDMKLAEGRFYSKEFTSETNSLVINETAAKMIEMKNPVGQKIKMWDDDLTIIGVVKDYNFSKLDSEIKPLAIRLMPGSRFSRLLFAKLNSNNISQTISFLETEFKNLNPEDPFVYSFLDEEFALLYETEQRMGKLFSSFSVLAVLISCLGLFGLASFMAERRTKEIGIRKVLGASVGGLTVLLSAEFFKLVVISNLIAWPVSYYFMNSWLQDFVYRTEMSLWIFPLSGLAALIIALLTVSYQSIKAALANPIKSIKYE